MDKSAVGARCRQNYHEECEAGINKQINLQLYASYFFQSMAYYFDRDDVALPGFHKLFKEHSEDERKHAEKLMKFQNSRGGRIVLKDVTKPPQDEWGSGLEALQASLQLEKDNNAAMLELHKLSSKHGDKHMSDFIEEEFLMEMVDEIKQLSDYITMLGKAGPGLGEYMFDKETLQEKE